MMVTPTLAAELEAVRAALSAERARIYRDYEDRLPDIESYLASVAVELEPSTPTPAQRRPNW